jgi:putative ABC transport system permease protein
VFTLTFKNLWASKLRFALTAFGVTLAVSFVVSAFVLADGLRSTFTRVSEEITAGVDLEVRNLADLGVTEPLPVDSVTTVAAVDGVADAAASIEAPDNAVRPIRSNGEIISTNGPPQLAFNWIDNDRLNPFRLVDGAPPAPGQFVMDLDAAAEHGFVIGDSYEFIVPDGRVQLVMSGTSSFGSENNTLGAVLMQMDTADASRLFGNGGIDSVVVQLADGADPQTVQNAIAAAVPGAEVVDHATVLDETAGDFTKEIDVVGNILLGFGGIALFVSIFIIHNTFGIVLSQRTRELALLRAIGAGPGQITRSTMGEALVMGLLASAAGVVGGVAVAKGIDALFGLMGVDLSEWPVILAPRTLIAAAVTGIGVTLLAARGPARRAAKIPPVAAINGAADDADRTSRRRAAGGLASTAAGALVAAGGVASGSSAVAGLGLAAGVMLIVLGVTVLSPLVVRHVTAVVGWPLVKFAGTPGRLAQRNAARNARLTATTASALMIGLALVTTALVVAQSVKATIGSAFERSARADYYVTDELDDVDFPATLADELRGSGVVDAAAGFTQVDARVDGTEASVVGFDFGQIDELLDLDVRAGGFDTRVALPAVVSVDRSEATGTGVGDVLRLEMAGGRPVEVTVVGLFDDQAILGEDYLVDTSVLTGAGIQPTAVMLALSISDDASPAAAEAFLTDLSAQYPNAFVETAGEFQDRVAGMIDDILMMVNVIVALAVVIALIGIANTLALSVFERTRELGLLRAVGMTRRQLRRMVRYEAALVAVFGATLGVGLGLVFGLGATSILPSTIASSFAVPVSQIVSIVLVAGVAGVLAAWLPARRAARLDVLSAIGN